MKISLAKALKIKNRLVGKITQLQTTVRTNNSVPEDENRSVNAAEAWEDLKKIREELISLKGKIGVATAPISEKLVRLTENKSLLTFLDTIPIKEGIEDKVVGYGAAAVSKQISYRNFIKESDKKHQKDLLQKEVEDLQDEIDEFNAVTKIEF